MIKEMYALKDNKVEAFGVPMYYLNEKLIIAELTIFMQEQAQEDISGIDYDLFFLGTYDTETGKHKTEEAPKHILNCRRLEAKTVDNYEKYREQDKRSIANQKELARKDQSQ